MLSVLHRQTHVYRWLLDCNDVRRVDCDPRTADDDVLQTPKSTGTIGTGAMVPCRVSSERRGHSLNVMRSVTSNQCRTSRRSCVRQRSYFRVFETIRAVVFMTLCCLWVDVFGAPASRLMQVNTTRDESMHEYRDGVVIERASNSS